MNGENGKNISLIPIENDDKFYNIYHKNTPSNRKLSALIKRSYDFNRVNLLQEQNKNDDNLTKYRKLELPKLNLKLQRNNKLPSLLTRIDYSGKKHENLIKKDKINAKRNILTINSIVFDENKSFKNDTIKEIFSMKRFIKLNKKNIINKNIINKKYEKDMNEFKLYSLNLNEMIAEQMVVEFFKRINKLKSLNFNDLLLNYIKSCDGKNNISDERISNINNLNISENEEKNKDEKIENNLIIHNIFFEWIITKVVQNYRNYLKASAKAISPKSIKNIIINEVKNLSKLFFHKKYDKIRTIRNIDFINNKNNDSNNSKEEKSSENSLENKKLKIKNELIDNIINKMIKNDLNFIEKRNRFNNYPKSVTMVNKRNRENKINLKKNLNFRNDMKKIMNDTPDLSITGEKQNNSELNQYQKNSEKLTSKMRKSLIQNTKDIIQKISVETNTDTTLIEKYKSLTGLKDILEENNEQPNVLYEPYYRYEGVDQLSDEKEIIIKKNRHPRNVSKYLVKYSHETQNSYIENNDKKYSKNRNNNKIKVSKTESNQNNYEFNEFENDDSKGETIMEHINIKNNKNNKQTNKEKEINNKENNKGQKKKNKIKEDKERNKKNDIINQNKIINKNKKDKLKKEKYSNKKENQINKENEDEEDSEFEEEQEKSDDEENLTEESDVEEENEEEEEENEEEEEEKQEEEEEEEEKEEKGEKENINQIKSVEKIKENINTNINEKVFEIKNNEDENNKDKKNIKNKNKKVTKIKDTTEKDAIIQDNKDKNEKINKNKDIEDIKENINNEIPVNEQLNKENDTIEEEKDNTINKVEKKIKKNKNKKLKTGKDKKVKDNQIIDEIKENIEEKDENINEIDDDIKKKKKKKLRKKKESKTFKAFMKENEDSEKNNEIKNDLNDKNLILSESNEEENENITEESEKEEGNENEFENNYEKEKKNRKSKRFSSDYRKSKLFKEKERKNLEELLKPSVNIFEFDRNGRRRTTRKQTTKRTLIYDNSTPENPKRKFTRADTRREVLDILESTTLPIPKQEIQEIPNDLEIISESEEEKEKKPKKRIKHKKPKKEIKLVKLTDTSRGAFEKFKQEQELKKEKKEEEENKERQKLKKYFRELKAIKQLDDEGFDNYIKSKFDTLKSIKDNNDIKLRKESFIYHFFKDIEYYKKRKQKFNFVSPINFKNN